MKTCTQTYSDYLRRKTSGEDIVSAATLYGIEAIAKTTDDFLVLDVNMKNISYYKYKNVEGKFHVTDFMESIPHTIAESITPELLHNEHVMRWWSHVFFEHDGQCTYDKYYDDLKVYEGNTISFKELIDKVSASISSIHIPCTASKVFLTGDLAGCTLLRYVLQMQLAPSRVHLLSMSSHEDFDENQLVTLPVERLDQLSLFVNGTFSYLTLASAPVSITLPLLSMGSEMTPGIKWEDMLVEQQKDYSVGNFDFKRMSVHVECDPFQNIFLSCTDIKGNRKVKQII